MTPPLRQAMSSHDEVVWLTTVRSSLQSATMDEGRSRICPMRILPPDILSEIFSMVCLGDYSLKIYRSRPFSKESLMSSPTLVLTQVCSYWRYLAFSLPLLWSSLSIESRHLYGRPALTSLILAYISRSGNVPLKFYLKTDGDAPGAELLVFDALLEHASRWKEAILHISLPWLLHANTRLGSRLFPGSLYFPKLELLVLSVQHASRSDLVLMYLPHQIIQSSPKLKLFHGLGYDFCFNARGFRSTYGGHSLVTKLVLYRFKGRSLGHLLARFPNLRTCSIGGFQLSEDVHIDIGLEENMPIYTSKITHLSHAAPWDMFQRGAWKFLRVPNLTSLDLHHRDYSLTELSWLLCQSESSLCEVKLYNFPAVEMIKFLSSHPSVLHLSVHVDGELGSLHQLTTGLTMRTNDWPIVPHLLSFELSWNDWRYKRLRDFNTITLQTGIRDAICGMVESRCAIPRGKTHPGLQRLSLRIRDGDFLEFDPLYKMIRHELSSVPDFVFDTFPSPLSCFPFRS
ncbi:hypothetical protein J3R30DRAFT_3466926 [Lentinula aciculospora]|uniref:F-box domain-containing protein n=1 Tax=Lentinula aciculospora TaxID=153920 RepID=A0A9W9AD60_9AGAR|nr:hypothetical protein J3R30DRAFT_3466926 [Lentinula aciculospora]